MIPTLLAILYGVDGSPLAAPSIGDACIPSGSSFLGFPNWYEYLKGVVVYAPDSGSTNSTAQYICSPTVSGLSDIWLIIAAIVEILLRVAALAAILMVIVGGVQYITGQGDPNKAAKARTTIISALAGLVIAVLAATAVTFIAGQFKT